MKITIYCVDIVDAVGILEKAQKDEEFEVELALLEEGEELLSYNGEIEIEL